MVRHGLPVVAVIGNNGIWALEKHPMEFLYGYSVAAELRPGTRYDQVVETLGGHGELVERPDELRPALERAFAPASRRCVNVLTDPRSSIRAARTWPEPSARGPGTSGREAAGHPLRRQRRGQHRLHGARRRADRPRACPGSYRTWRCAGRRPAADRYFGRLASFSRLIMFDKRGQGLSDRPPAPPTLEESADDVRAVLDAAGSERPRSIGISEGGPMSMLLAASHPERVAALVLYGTWARIVERADNPWGSSRSSSSASSVVRRDWGGPVGAQPLGPSLAEDRRSKQWWAKLLRARASPAGAERGDATSTPSVDVRAVAAGDRRADAGHAPPGDRMVPIDQGRCSPRASRAQSYVELAGTTTFRSALGGDSRRDRGVPDRERAASEPRPDAGDRHVHRHRRLDRAAAELGDRGWRELLGATTSWCGASSSASGAARSRRGRRLPRHIRRPARGDRVRVRIARRGARAGRRDPGRAAHRRGAR